MKALLLYINWNPDPVFLNIAGNFSIRYYGLLWVVGILLSYLMVRQQYIDRKIDEKKFDPLFFYCFFGMIIGARLGHCLFYEPEYYMNHVAEMFLPVKFLPDGGWKWIGYQGLASHGGTLCLIIALILYSRKYKIHIVDIFDIIAIATPICACCIRLANLMNSEIIGKPTDVPWAFIFERVDMLPRHPAQLYEAMAYFLFFIIMVVLYKKLKTYKRGFFFGLVLTEIFVFRFFIEFLKEDQVAFEEGMTFNMGQLLSIPFVIIGIYFMCFYKGKRMRMDVLEEVKD